jgi:hypothetical protein
MLPLRKNKLAIGLAAAYLLLVLLVSSPLLFDAFLNDCKGGLHSSATMSMLFTLILTLPVSWLLNEAIDAFLPKDAIGGCFTIVSISTVSALVNAVLIYGIISIIHRWLKRIWNSRQRL